MTQPAQTNLSVVKPPLPGFEGMPVESVSFKISGMASEGIKQADDKALCVDDRVRIVGDYRVTAVNFKVDPKTGDLVREHLLKPEDLSLTPYDPSNPQDDGVWRARPQSVPQP